MALTPPRPPPSPPQVELQSLMAIADVDGDGLIDYNEFVGATMHLSKLEKEELLQKVRRCLLSGLDRGASVVVGGTNPAFFAVSKPEEEELLQWLRCCFLGWAGVQTSLPSSFFRG